MHRFVSTLAAFLLAIALIPLAPAHSLTAQDRLPDEDARALNFGLPSGGGFGVGLRWMTSERASLQLDMVGHLQWDDRGEDESATRWSLSLRPEYRIFRGDVSAPVVPFVMVAGSLGHADQESGSTTSVEVSTGFGAEWFPLEAMSISGSTGVALEYQRTSPENDALANRSRVGLGLFRSALTISLWY